jgi:hypothetical protein
MTPNGQLTAFTIGEDRMPQPYLGNTIPLVHRANPEQTTFGRAIADIVVERQLFGNRFE